MSEILKVCIAHGELKKEQLICKKDDRYLAGYSYTCKKCHADPDFWKGKEVKKTCIHHGELNIENIRIKGRELICRLCQWEERRQHKETNRERLNAAQRELYQKHIHKERERSKVKYRKTEKQCFEGHIKRTYGLSPEKYYEMLNEQDSKCKICGNKETRKQTNKYGDPDKICRLTVDHDHETGKVRGLLCHSCNTGIGKFKESIELMQKAIEYLESHK